MYYHAHIKKGQFIILSIFILLIPFLAYGYLAAADSYPALFPPCGLKTQLHLYCPGCGGTRAVGQLLHLHIIESLLCNPLVVYMAACTIYYYFKTLVFLVRQHGDAQFDIHLGFLWVFLVILIVFCLARNILMVNFGIDYLGEAGKYW